MKKYKPVVIFRAKDDFEAQYARDILKNNNIQVLHVPSPTVAIYGTICSRRIAVNENDVDQAIELLRKNNLIAEKEKSLGKGRDMEDAINSFWLSREGKRMGLIFFFIAPLILPYLLWRWIREKSRAVSINHERYNMKGCYVKCKGKKGYTIAELLLVTSIVTSISTGTYMLAKKKAVETVCHNNLNQINNALTMFLIENNDQLPDAVFYPDDMSSNKGIHNILKPYIRGNVFVCSSLPKELQERGLTYLWNDNFSEKRRDRIIDANQKWLMIEMTAVYKDIPPPHSRGYTILYVDGHIDYSQEAPNFAPAESFYNLYNLRYLVLWSQANIALNIK